MKRPTFEQFVDYLLRTDVSEYNDHWIPIWLHCRICLMEFDVIGEHKLMQKQYTVFLCNSVVYPRQPSWRPSLRTVTS